MPKPAVTHFKTFLQRQTFMLLESLRNASWEKFRTSTRVCFIPRNLTFLKLNYTSLPSFCCIFWLPDVDMWQAKPLPENDPGEKAWIRVSSWGRPNEHQLVSEGNLSSNSASPLTVVIQGKSLNLFWFVMDNLREGRTGVEISISLIKSRITFIRMPNTVTDV